MRSWTLALLMLAAAAAPALAEEVAPDAAAPAAVAEKALKPAEVRAEQLDILFARLRKAGDEGGAAEPIVQKIWGLWSASDSPTAEVLLLQAQRAMDAGAPAEAMKILDRLIGANPDFAEAWNKRATLYYMMKRDDLSLKDIEKVLDLEPRHFGALAGRGMIYQRQKKYGAALDAFREALSVNPAMDAVRQAIKDIERIEQGI